MPDPLAWVRRFRAASSSRESSETGCWGVEHSGSNREPAIGSGGVEARGDFFDGLGQGVEHRQAETRVTQPRQERGRPGQAAEILGGFDQGQIGTLVTGSVCPAAHSGRLSSFGYQDYHFPAEALGEKAIALRQRQERGTREQARELIRHGRRPRGGQQAMPLHGVPDGSCERLTIYLPLEQEILCAITDHVFGQGSCGRFDQEDDGNMRGSRLDLAECFGALTISEIRIEQDDIHRVGRQDGLSVDPGGRVGRLQMNPVAPAAGAVQFGQDFA